MTARYAGALLLSIATAACTATPWDFPVPTMIGNRQGGSMTGFMKTDSEAEVKRRLAERMKCPDELEFASLTTRRADNKAGTHILHYQAVMRCADVAAGSGISTTTSTAPGGQP